MTNLIVCKTGTTQLAAHLDEDAPPFSAVTLVGDDPSSELKLLRNNVRGHYLNALTLKSKQKGVTLGDPECLRISKLALLRSLTLTSFDCSPENIRRFTNLTHLCLSEVSVHHIGAIITLQALTSLTLGTPLSERGVNYLSPLKQLTELLCPWNFTKPVKALLLLVKTFPKLKTVTTLAGTNDLAGLIQPLKYEAPFYLKRLFALTDSSQRDLFHYVRQSLDASGPDQLEPLMRHVDTETASPEQLTAWLDYALTEANRFIFEKVLSLNVDVNEMLPEKKRALAVAVSGSIRKPESYNTFVTRLLESGANPTLSDGTGTTILQTAVRALRPDLIKQFFNTKYKPSQEHLNTLLETAITLCIVNWQHHPNKAANASRLVASILSKQPSEQVLTAQLERLVKCEVAIPVELIARLLTAGARSDVPNSDGHTVKNELLRAIHKLDKERSTNKALVEAKFAYFEAITEKGDKRMKSYKELIQIASAFGFADVVTYLKKQTPA